MESEMAFIEGFSKGACDCGMRLGRTIRTIQAILPKDKESCWRDLLNEIDPDQTEHIGHQTACLLACVKRTDHYAALSTLHLILTRALKGIKYITNN